jgi:threonine/homoserine/homoserine lactone efflux protein
VLPFAQGATLGFSAAAQPGPFQAYLLAQSAREGPLRALPLALVPLVSDPPVIAAVLALLAQVPPGLLRALQIGGGAFVLWLGASGLRAALRPAAADAGAREPPRGFWRAVLVNLTNPNAWIFWSLVGGPILAEAWRAAPARALAFLAGFYLLLLGGNAALVLAFGAAGRLGPRAAGVLGVLSSAALLAFGGWQVARGLALPWR